MEFANAALTRWSKKCNFIRKAGEWSSRFTKPLVVTYVVDNCGDQLAATPATKDRCPCSDQVPIWLKLKISIESSLDW
jgi:hypothetical protein